MRNTIRFFALAAGLALAGCSTYQKRWEAARDSVRPGAQGHSGAYQGRWDSTKMPGTGGKLWCILSEDSPGFYRAEFKATWHGVFRSEHVAMLKMDGPDDFHGDATLHAIIGSGTYHCAGKLSPSGLSARYDATYDTGTFQLGKAGPAEKSE
jgi:hypothetical protein